MINHNWTQCAAFKSSMIFNKKYKKKFMNTKSNFQLLPWKIFNFPHLFTIYLTNYCSRNIFFIMYVRGMSVANKMNLLNNWMNQFSKIDIKSTNTSIKNECPCRWWQWYVRVNFGRRNKSGIFNNINRDISI